MNALIKTLLSMSLSGSLLILLLLAIRSLLRKRTSRVFQYYLWILVLLRLSIPLSLGFGILPYAFEWVPEIEISQVNESATAHDINRQIGENQIEVNISGNAPLDTVSDAAQQTVKAQARGSDASLIAVKDDANSIVPVINAGNIFSASFWSMGHVLNALWAAGMVLSVLMAMLKYRRFVHMIKGASHLAAPEEQALLSGMTDRTVELRRSMKCATPMLVGMRHPIIFLPEQAYGPARLRNILLHELTHLQRWDLLYKWLMGAICAVHWFNPLMPLLRREVNRACELACDEVVIRNMDQSARLGYGETLLAVATDMKYSTGIVNATMCEEKRSIRERIGAIGSHRELTGMMIWLAVMTLALAMGVTALLGVFTPVHQGDGSEWLMELCDNAEEDNKTQAALLKQFAAYLQENSNDFTAEDIKTHYDHAELMVASEGGGSIELFYRDPMGLVIADRLSCDGADASVSRERSTVQDVGSLGDSEAIRVIYDPGYAYGYYVVIWETKTVNGKLVSSIRCYDAQKQRAAVLESFDTALTKVTWQAKKSTYATTTFTVFMEDGTDVTYKCDPVTMESTLYDGVSVGEWDDIEKSRLSLQEEMKAQPYEDLRGEFSINGVLANTLKEEEYTPDRMVTYTFNSNTVFTNHEEEAAAILEAGKNPGLGIRDLHAQGITGAGVNVAIIDQNILLDHPEFEGKIAAYYDTGCEQPEDRGSMHGPAVTSLLVGESIGVAPDAKVYYAAAPSWKRDSAYYAIGLRWIIRQNAALPEEEKIRVVSVSAAPSGSGSPFMENKEQWNAAVAEAQAVGILVLDCRDTLDTGFIWPAFYNPQKPEDVTAMSCGFPSMFGKYMVDTTTVHVPTSFRTVAEEYQKGMCFYQYTGEGGLSWGIPYAAGVLALGWQIDPSLTSEEIVDLLRESCYQSNDGVRFIDPPAFIEAVRAQLNG